MAEPFTKEFILRLFRENAVDQMDSDAYVISGLALQRFAERIFHEFHKTRIYDPDKPIE